MKKSRLSALLMAAGLLAGANAMAGDMRAAVVSNPCAGCHGTDGASAGEAPVIAGLSRVYLMQTMQNYKNGTRFSTIMGRIAKGYDSGQMNDMAVFYSELPWVDGKQDIDADLAAKGKDLHNSRGCNTCHGANGISPMPAAPVWLASLRTIWLCRCSTTKTRQTQGADGHAHAGDARRPQRG